MSRHRKIDVRMWGDAKFRSLSKPQPNAQSLWIYLLTGPHTTSIPGLFHIGEAALAEALGWTMKAFREAFQEVLSKGMLEADFDNRLIWVPKAIFYNMPENPNVVKSWRTYWDEIPECELKIKAHDFIFQSLKGFREGFAKVFAEGCQKATFEVLNTPLPNQEQEQEQEQEQDLNTPPPPKGECDRFEEFWKVFPAYRKQGKAKANRIWHFKTKNTDPDFIISAAKEYAESPVGKGRYVKGPIPWLNQECWNDDRAAWQRQDTDNNHRGDNGQQITPGELAKREREEWERKYGKPRKDSPL